LLLSTTLHVKISMSAVAAELSRPAFHDWLPHPKRDAAGENMMSRSPFLNDPLEQLSKHIAAAVSSPVEEVRAMHIRAAEHLSQLAKENGIARQQRQVSQRRDI
jgi:hypothetical protein